MPIDRGRSGVTETECSWKQRRGVSGQRSGGIWGNSKPRVTHIPEEDMAGRLVVVLPSRGEMGLKIRYHVPNVHAIRGTKTVLHEEGEEALYPSAMELMSVPRVEDDLRRGTHPRGDAASVAKFREMIHARNPNAEVVQTRKGMPEARFIPVPHVLNEIKADFVICPRGRKYGASKNWPHWETLLDLPGNVFAAGAPDSSLDVQTPRAWDHERFLDASIEGMRSAKLVISTDAGLAHLAVLCGVPLLIITYKGLSAPGPVMDPDGRTMQPKYWPVRFEEYYQKARHTDAPIWTTEAWDDPDEVFRLAVQLADPER